MRESEGKWKEAGAAESLAPKSFINDQSPVYKHRFSSGRD